MNTTNERIQIAPTYYWEAHADEEGEYGDIWQESGEVAGVICENVWKVDAKAFAAALAPAPAMSADTLRDHLETIEGHLCAAMESFSAYDRLNDAHTALLKLQSALQAHTDNLKEAK